MDSLVIYNSINRITQHYGNGHHGVDLGYSKDEDKNIVYANSLGIVVEVVDKYDNDTKSKGSKTWGNYVLIKHPNGYHSRYAHLKKHSISVKVGDTVDEKTPIGIIGDSGKAYGRHLHFEVSKNYSSSTRINPEPYLYTPIYKNSYLTGKYRLIESKAIRKNHVIANNIVLVKNCKESVKPLLTSTKPNAQAYFKKGVTVGITDIYVEKNNRIWGKLTNTWIVIQNKDGKPQAKFIDG